MGAGRPDRPRPAHAGVPDHRWEAGLDRALAVLWPEVPAQRCIVHKHRNLLANAPNALHGEVSADYTDMIYAETAKQVEA